MMGIPYEGQVFVDGESQFILYNTTVPDSILNKKSNFIAFHFVREGCAMDEWCTSYINTELNHTELLAS